MPDEGRHSIPDDDHPAPSVPAGTALDETERMVLAYTDQVLLHVKAPDAMFEALCERLTPGGVAELTLVIGFYMLVSRFLENFEIDIEPPGTVE